MSAGRGIEMGQLAALRQAWVTFASCRIKQAWYNIYLVPEAIW